MRPLSDTDDTTANDSPARYLEIAQAEGFFIAAQFDSAAPVERAETLWVLNEPFSGFLLTLVTSDSEVVDATLHYNVHTDAAGLQRAPFPEHRDPESGTIYVREGCVTSLRERCRRLRATDALLKEWRVTPTIPLLTPAEWEAIASADAAGTDADRIRAITSARIAELPTGLRAQIHLRE